MNSAREKTEENEPECTCSACDSMRNPPKPRQMLIVGSHRSGKTDWVREQWASWPKLPSINEQQYLKGTWIGIDWAEFPEQGSLCFRVDIPKYRIYQLRSKKLNKIAKRWTI